jgi:aldehyde:ferredoxin oxidoreductase
MSIAGTILRVDMSTGKIVKEPTLKYVKDFVGGELIGAAIFTREVPPETRPFDPENYLIISTGPLTGTLLGNKAIFSTKAPNSANSLHAAVGMGGQIPSEIKFAGYDQIVIKGRAEKLSYLYINNDEVEIRNAEHLAGLDTFETQRKLKEELGDPDLQIACIGPAGENKVIYAIILHDINNTAARRCGAVMGSKRLKAIVVRGTKGLKVPDPKAFLAVYDKYFEELTQGRGKACTAMLHAEGLARQIPEGYIFAYGTEVTDKVPYSYMKEVLKKYLVGTIGCAFCPVQCHENWSVPGIGNGGANCVNYFGLITRQMYDLADFEIFWEKTLLSNKLGIDTLSMEMIGNWLMELYKRGIISDDETDDIPMERRSRKAIAACVEKIARREGFGRLFTDGIIPACERIGKGHLDLADQYDNDFPYGWVEYAPDIGPVAKYRVAEVERVPGFADGYGNIPSFADALGISPVEVKEMIDRWADEACKRVTGDPDLWKKPYYDERISKMMVEKENEILIADVTGHCEVTSAYLDHYGYRFNIDDYAEWMTVTTGITYTPADIREAAHKLRVITDAYNALCTITNGREPVLAKPMEELTSFPVPGRPKDPAELRHVQSDYCVARGYDPETGIPTRPELERLGLKYLADKLDTAMQKTAKQPPKPQKKNGSRAIKGRA